MNDNASLALGAPRGGLGGLPQRLVQDGVVDEAAMLEAVNAARERKTSVVSQLVSSGAASARDIAVAASNEFGVPLIDLDALNPDLDSVRLVSDKLLAKHRVLPLYRRGKRLFLAVADPTNLTRSTRSSSRPASASRRSWSRTTSSRRRSTRRSSRSTTRCPLSAAKRTSTSKRSRSQAARMSSTTRSPATTSKTPRSCASSTSSCWMPSAAAPPTFTSSRSKRPTAYAFAWTECSRRSPSRRWYWRPSCRRA